MPIKEFNTMFEACKPFKRQQNSLPSIECGLQEFVLFYSEAPHLELLCFDK